jgi:ubiquitin C-terminal hydrolase
LIDVIEDETNQARDKAVPPALTTLQESQVQEQSYNARIKFYWLRYCSTHRSPITEKFTLSTMTINTCRGCHLVTTNHSNITHYLGLNMPRNQAYTLDDLLRRQYASDGRVTEALEDVKCDKCWAEKGIKTGRLVTEMITRLPDTLVIHLIRHAFAGTGGKKNNSLVRFPLDDLDMTPYVFKRPDTEMQKHEGRSITHYRCYAVVQHRGETLKEGHFFTLVRDKKNNQWYEYNDTDVTRVNAGDTQDSRSYLLFYERIE